MNIDQVKSIADEIAPVYCMYSGQLQPQDAHIEIAEDGTVTADYSGEIGNAVPMHVWHNRTIRIGINPTLSGADILEFVESHEDLIQTVIDNHSVDWDGSNWVGHLTEAGEEALDSLQDAARDLESAHPLWDASEWLFTERGLARLIGNSETIESFISDAEAACDVRLIGSIRDAVLECGKSDVEDLCEGFTRTHLDELLALGAINAAAHSAYIEEYFDGE